MKRPFSFSMSELEQYEKQQRETDAIARNALKQVAALSGLKYGQVADAFKKGQYAITQAFWEIVESEYPNTYNRVEYCHGCQAFHLWFQPESAAIH